MRPLRWTDAALPAYLDIEEIVSQAVGAGCDRGIPVMVFFERKPAFAEAVEAAGMVFVGPTIQSLSVFGDKAQARALAEASRCAGAGWPISVGQRDRSRGIFRPTCRGWCAAQGDRQRGGRGMRIVRTAQCTAYARCVSEATAAFGDGALYVEQLVDQARHIEVQIVGDGSGAVCHLGERTNTFSVVIQKLIEVARAPRWLRKPVSFCVMMRSS